MCVHLKQISVLDVDPASGPAHPQRSVTSQTHLINRLFTGVLPDVFTVMCSDSLIGSGAENKCAALSESGWIPLKHTHTHSVIGPADRRIMKDVN